MTAAEHHYRPTCLPPMVRSRFPHRATCSCSWVADRGSSSGGLAMAAWETHRDEERRQAVTRSPRIAQDAAPYLARLHEAAGHYAAAHVTWSTKAGEAVAEKIAMRHSRDRLVDVARAFLDEWGGAQGTMSLSEISAALVDDPVAFAAWRYAWNWRRVDRGEVVDAGVIAMTRLRLLAAARSEVAP